MMTEEVLRRYLHDMNNILTIALSSADLVLLDLVEDSHLKQDIESIIKACEQGRDLVESMRKHI